MQFKMEAVENESVGEWISKAEIRTSKKFQAAGDISKHVWLYSDLLSALEGKRSQLSVLNNGTLISASALLLLQGFFWGTSPAYFFLFFLTCFSF